MNRSRKKVEVLRQIANVRTISVKLAEAQCIAANQTLANAQNSRERLLEKLGAVKDGWAGAVSDSNFNPENVYFWSYAINQAASSAEKAATKSERCLAELNQVKEHMAIMVANEQCAQALLAKATKKHSKDIEEKHLAELSDQITRFMGVRWH